ncbi:MAG: glycerol-3-phosphate 1-O-acyltransferase PlsY [Erysipelotrichaceae bacterium]|nr:glycerol-3-phosphate 1-O-acyltransferase PlsY [Erysipelotrichaceae bacterium]
MEYIYTAIISYLLGSINTAYILAKSKGFDIRERGSNNAGASNVKLNLGWGAAVVTGLCDMLKAIIAIKLSSYLFPDNEVIPFLAGAMAIVGHIFPFYMGFRGGKGFASYLGMLLALNWKLALVMMALTVIVTFITNYIALATLCTVTIVPLYYIYMKANPICIAILLAVTVLIYYKHRINIQRIIRHEEIGFRDKKKKETEQQKEEDNK